LDKILHLGIPSSGLSLYEVKIRKLFNGLSFVGFFIAIVHILTVYGMDFYAPLFHGIWGVLCIAGLIIHYLGSFKIARFLVCFSIIVLGGMASARIGQELYPHIASLGIMVGTFIFFDVKKEWKYILFLLLVGVSMYAIVETDWYKNDEIVVDNPYAMRLFTLVGTVVFVAFEITFLLRLSWLNENYINTELVKTNEQLEESLEEKKILLQEVHHRVKNNFQVILSLIKLQTEDVTDAKSKSIFFEIRNRLSAIALMHEMMYKSDQLYRINFTTYIENLAKTITEASSDNASVDVQVNSAVEFISNESIIPIALILNELFSNSFKHAFKESTDDKKIVVKIESLGKDKIKINYSDNGTWKDSTTKSFGLDLINMLVDQLSGDIKRNESESGTYYELIVKI
jgi:two-component system, sensor histidine kinase PdtaS